MKRLAIVEGAFDPLTPADATWLQQVRRGHGRIHVALWPEGERSTVDRAAALTALPFVWEVHVGRAKDVEPWLRQDEPEAKITIMTRSSAVFVADPVQADMFEEKER